MLIQVTKKIKTFFTNTDHHGRPTKRKEDCVRVCERECVCDREGVSVCVFWSVVRFDVLLLLCHRGHTHVLAGCVLKIKLCKHCPTAVCPNLFTFGSGPCHKIKVKICHGRIRLQLRIVKYALSSYPDIQTFLHTLVLWHTLCPCTEVTWINRDSDKLNTYNTITLCNY